MSRMELGERIKRLIDGLERAVAAWRAEGSVVFGIYAQVADDHIQKLRDMAAYSAKEQREAVTFLAQELKDKAVFVAHGRAMEELREADVSAYAEYVQLIRLAEQVANLLNPLPVGR